MVEAVTEAQGQIRAKGPEENQRYQQILAGRKVRSFPLCCPPRSPVFCHCLLLVESSRLIPCDSAEQSWGPEGLIC